MASASVVSRKLKDIPYEAFLFFHSILIGVFPTFCLALYSIMTGKPFYNYSLEGFFWIFVGGLVDTTSCGSGMIAF
jgi:hypothetical protein